MPSWITDVPLIDRALVVAMLVVALVALSVGSRGRHFRSLPGWAGFWALFAPILVCLSRLAPAISLPLLGLVMFAGLRSFFFQVPVRPKDRSGHVFAFASVPAVLYLGYVGPAETFLATMPIVLFLLVPALLAIGRAQQGYLDAVGRILLGVLLYVFCLSHLSLLVAWDGAGVIELFGVLVLGAELPQRLAGRLFQAGWIRATAGLFSSAVLATLLGYSLAPMAGLGQDDGARAGLLVMVGVSLGAIVGEAIVRDLGQSSSEARVGRGAFLDRSIPAAYAAPIFFHYLSHFA